MNLSVIAALGMVASHSALFAADKPPAGVIQICRASLIEGLHQNERIVIPAGATVVDIGFVRDGRAGSEARPVRLATTRVAELPTGSNCVFVPARVEWNPKRLPVRVADGRRYAPTGSATAYQNQWMFLATYRITVVRDFR
ncbi:MAG TPA: hypothetical protein VKY65_04480 [Alphaproteobacteria bacterium]|nr:hypothetical protein [Alphaproteobacteria bacterium]